MSQAALVRMGRRPAAQAGPEVGPREASTIPAASQEGPLLHQAPLHLLTPCLHATSREEGTESTGKEPVAERGTNRDFKMLKKRGGSISLPSPRRAFHCRPTTCSHCSSNLTTPATGTIHASAVNIFFPPHGNMLPSLPWLSPPPLLSENHRQERDQLDKNLNQCKCEVQSKKKSFAITGHAADIVPSNCGNI